MTDTVGWMNDRLVVMLAEAKQEERQRIVELLEANNRCANELGHSYVADCYCEAIALIKGESK